MIRVVQGDITRQPVEAVVTAANSALRNGTGVNGAVHEAAGHRLQRASRLLAPCPAGGAVVTPAFDLAPVRWVIHAVGPDLRRGQDPQLLAAAYRSALARADEVGARSVAFPSISTGRYKYPHAAAARISVQALRTTPAGVEDILLVAYDDRMARLWAQELQQGP